MKTFTGVRSEILLKVVDRLSKRRSVLKDMYGYNSYVRENRGTVYTDRSYPGSTLDYGSRVYSKYLITSDSQSLEDMYNGEIKQEAKEASIKFYAKYFDLTENNHLQN